MKRHIVPCESSNLKRSKTLWNFEFVDKNDDIIKEDAWKSEIDSKFMFEQTQQMDDEHNKADAFNAFITKFAEYSIDFDCSIKSFKSSCSRNNFEGFLRNE